VSLVKITVAPDSAARVDLDAFSVWEGYLDGGGGLD
jgi:hypothetical protein